MDFGAFVNFFGPKDGLVHVSELAPKRVNKPSDVVKEGQAVKVKLLGFDDRGKVRLSMKQVDQTTGEDLSKKATAEVRRLVAWEDPPARLRLRGRFCFCAEGDCRLLVNGRLGRSCARRRRALYWSFMTILMRLVSLILIVAALVFLGADAVTSLERGGELTVRWLGTRSGRCSIKDGLKPFKNWGQHYRPPSPRRRLSPPWRCRPGR